MNDVYKKTERGTAFAAVSTIVTALLNAKFNLAPEINGAVVVLVIAVLTYLDALIHGSKLKVNGLWFR